MSFPPLDTNILSQIPSKNKVTSSGRWAQLAISVLPHPFSHPLSLPSSPHSFPYGTILLASTHTFADKYLFFVLKPFNSLRAIKRDFSSLHVQMGTGSSISIVSAYTKILYYSSSFNLSLQAGKRIWKH